MLRAKIRLPVIRNGYFLSRQLGTNAAQKFQPILYDLTAELSQNLPRFTVPADGISVLAQPSEFYSILLDMIRNAEKRIFISSLYIGSSEHELISTLKTRLTEKAGLHLYLQLDLNRSTRPGPSSTATILLPLLRHFPDRVHVSLFRSPSLRGIMAKIVPPRFNEGWGTWHAKIYGADDDLIISGANLNNAYFTNRRDRYLRFTAQPRLAEYCFSFLQEMSTFSYRLLPADSRQTTNPHSYTSGDYTVVWSDPETHPHHISEQVHRALSAFQASHRVGGDDTENPALDVSSPLSNNPSAKPSILLFPMIQAGQFRIREEERFFQLLFGHLKKAAMRAMLPDVGSLPFGISSVTQSRPLMDWTSGYFSLYKPYQQLILGTPAVGVKIVCSSPKANGFFGSKGISGRIPEGYTFLEQKFMKAVRKTARNFARIGFLVQGNVELREWEKEGWTYHAKGDDSSFWFMAITFRRFSAGTHSVRIDESKLAFCGY
ncbi:hypothetical protein D9757_011923 [Collybiopsis confluens]|uniref:CDP-diacylglycerol--glycerol-3-phosphate 3-phosphatidyltransferase n=1 Tax=Collybiopsis confluens TaxID=2823264 RepID=A0A8H5LR33_9AGAR|nr:hypothetical protein D9757_011923 [Collybiopsis confluens]